MIEIRKLTEENIPLLWSIEDRRLDSERVVIRAKAGGFELDYRALPGALWRVGNAQKEIKQDISSWIEGTHQVVYFAWLDGELAGQMLLETSEDNLASIRDIRVAMPFRRRGVGNAFIALAQDWAKQKNFFGLLAETQDVNAGACQFFSRCGFQMGGLDTMRYMARAKQIQLFQNASMRETALFFYKFFDRKI